MLNTEKEKNITRWEEDFYTTTLEKATEYHVKPSQVVDFMLRFIATCMVEESGDIGKKALCENLSYYFDENIKFREKLKKENE